MEMSKQQAMEYIDKTLEINSVLKEMYNMKVPTIHQNFSKVFSENNFLSVGEYRSKIFSYYRNIFSNVFSNSVIVWKDPDQEKSWRGGETISAGRYGFGIRRHKQAKAVENFEDLIILKKHKDDIIKGLNERKKFKKAEEIGKFLDLVKDSGNDTTESFILPITKPLSAIQGRYDKMEKTPIKSIQVSYRGNFNGNLGSVHLRYIPLSEKDTSGNINELGYNDWSNGNYYEFLNSFLFEDLKEELVDSLKSQVIEKGKTQKETLEVLEKEFGIYMMSANL